MYDVLEGPDLHIYGNVNLGFEPPAYEVPERPDWTGRSALNMRDSEGLAVIHCLRGEGGGE